MPSRTYIIGKWGKASHLMMLGIIAIVPGCEKSGKMYDETRVRNEVPPIVARIPGLKGIEETCWKVRHTGDNSFMSVPGMNETSYELCGFAKLAEADYDGLKTSVTLSSIGEAWYPAFYPDESFADVRSGGWLLPEGLPEGFFRRDVTGSIYVNDSVPVVYYVLRGE